MATGGMALSKEFFELIKAIGESKSKQEEDRIIAREVLKLKSKLEPVAPGANHPLQSKKKSKEFLVRLLYVEMLGHDASFGYIKAVEMAASVNLYLKRCGYLVCGACLPPTHEFRFMLVNQMQRDLQSTNVLEVSGGVLACTSIITADMVPAVATEVTRLLSHESATLRKKSIVCLHRFHQLADEVVTESQLSEYLRKSLCDKDPSVMGASLNVLEAMCTKNTQLYKELVPSLVSILKQVAEHRLPSDFEYHRVPAPWIQMKLIRILGILGHADASVSSGCYEILQQVMRQADTGINAGYAVVYECIKTIVRLYPNQQLLDMAADAISRFIQSRSHNLKYLGVNGLALIVETNAQYAAQHQLAVMDCLEDPDETLQRKTLDLLYRMTNPVNVEFIADKLVEFLSGTTDLFLKKLLAKRVCAIAEKYAPSNAWYIKTITKLMQSSGDMIDPQVAHNLMSLIAEGTGDSEEADMLLRQNAIELYVEILQTTPAPARLPRILIETMSWCLGEYGYLSAVTSTEDLLHRLCELANEPSLTVETRKFVVQSVFKLVAQYGSCPNAAANLIDRYTKSKDCDLQIRCLEFQNMLTTCPHILPEILPVDASAEDVDVDADLSFLDGFVQQALDNGARPYSKPEDDDDDDDGDGLYANGTGTGSFNLTPYEKPTKPSHMFGVSGMGSATRPNSHPSGVTLPPGASSPSVGAAPTPAPLAASGGLALNTRNVANVWGKGGLAAAPPPAPSAASVASAPAPGDNRWETAAAPPQSSSSSLHGGYGNSFGATTAPAPAKTAAQIEKERQAAALFGGIIPGSAPPPPPAPAPTAPPPPQREAVTAPPAPQAPAPAAEIDLLDMSLWDAPAPSAPAPAPDFDVLSPVPTESHAAITNVETVSDDDESKGTNQTPQPAAAPQPAPDDDPFAGAGLLDGLSDNPLPSFSTDKKFEYNGNTMAPLRITTPQFGQQWGPMPAQSPGSIVSPKVASLNQFMDICSEIGLHPVEAISATNEGICAGSILGGSQIALVHGKVAPMGGSAKVDFTVKSTDSSMGSSLAMYLQTMLR